jgi:hypothetical protein
VEVGRFQFKETLISYKKRLFIVSIRVEPLDHDSRIMKTYLKRVGKSTLIDSLHKLSLPILDFDYLQRDTGIVRTVPVRRPISDHHQLVQKYHL